VNSRRLEAGIYSSSPFKRIEYRNLLYHDFFSSIILPWASFPSGGVGVFPSGSIELFSWSKIATALQLPMFSYASTILQFLMYLAFGSWLYHFIVLGSTGQNHDKQEKMS